MSTAKKEHPRFVGWVLNGLLVVTAAAVAATIVGVLGIAVLALGRWLL